MPKNKIINTEPCKCGKISKCRGYCTSCYNKLLLQGYFDESVQKCSAINCNKRIKGRTDDSIPLCNAHYSKWYRINKQDKNYDKNRYTKIRKAKLKITKNTLRKSISGRYTCGKSHAKKKGMLWTITKKWFIEQMTKDICYYCKGKLNNGGYSLDRLNSDLGYTEENSVSCCWNCNNLKGNYLTPKETLEIIELLKKLRNKDNIWD